jgi:hypothetical protein
MRIPRAAARVDKEDFQEEQENRKEKEKQTTKTKNPLARARM